MIPFPRHVKWPEVLLPRDTQSTVLPRQVIHPSVCLWRWSIAITDRNTSTSQTNGSHIGWNTSKVISRLISWVRGSPQKMQRLSLDNFRASENILTELFQAMWWTLVQILTHPKCVVHCNLTQVHAPRVYFRSLSNHVEAYWWSLMRHLNQ